MSERVKDVPLVLLAKLGLIPDEEMEVLTGTTDGSRENWHRRGMGPPRIRLGNRNYYHLDAAKQYIDLLMQDRIAKHSELGVGDVSLKPLRKSSRGRRLAHE